MPKSKKFIIEKIEGVGPIVALTPEEHAKVNGWKKSNPLLKVQDEMSQHISNQLFGPKHAQVILGNTPSKSNCYRIITFRSKDPNKHSGHASLAKTTELKKYEEQFYIQCNKYRNANIDEYFKFEMDVYYPTQRSDLDNSLKVVLDCLQKIGAISNDSLCTELHVRKFLDKNKPRVEFTITKAMK